MLVLVLRCPAFRGPEGLEFGTRQNGRESWRPSFSRGMRDAGSSVGDGFLCFMGLG